MRLPTEIIVHIPSLTNLGYYHDRRSILIACHRINEILREGTEIWWKVTYDCTSRSLWAAHIAITRSKGTPQVLAADLSSWASRGQSASAKSFLGRWRDERLFQGNRLHTLELTGILSAFPVSPGSSKTHSLVSNASRDMLYLDSMATTR